jgi:hypothetical protein
MKKGVQNMTRQEYDSLCSAARAGEGRYVENKDTLETGRVLACRLDQLEVDVSGKREIWTQGASRPVKRLTPKMPA